MDWKEKRVLITGITGFIGSRIAEMLVEKGASVAGIAQFSCVDDLQNLKSIEDTITLFRADLTDGNIIRKIFRDYRPHVVFHMGAVTHVHYSFERPVETMNTNVLGITHLLEACREYPVDKFVYAGSSEEYGNQPPENMPLTEESPLMPSSPYAVSKVAADHLCQVYYESYNVPCVRVRNFNSFGRKTDANFVTEKIIYHAIKQGVVKLGTPKSTRDFNHVDNVADAFIFLSEHPQAVGAVTVIASEKERTIEEHANTILRLIKEETGTDARVVWNSFPPRPNELWRLCGDMSKLENMGWKPKLSYEEGLKKTIKHWHSVIGKQHRKSVAIKNLLEKVHVIADGFMQVNAKIEPAAFFEPDKKIIPIINEAWNDYIKSGGRNYYTPVCTVKSYKPVSNSLMLNLGRSDFKVSYAYSSNYAKIKEEMGTAFRDEIHNPSFLCVLSAIITLDNKIIVGLRSDSVASYRNHWHVIGGAVEPLPELIDNEMLNLEKSMLKEIEEELCINAKDVAFSYPTALVRSIETGAMILLMVSKLNISSSEVLQKTKNASDEHSKVLMLGLSELSKLLNDKWVPEGLAAIHYCLQNHKLAD